MLLHTSEEFAKPVISQSEHQAFGRPRSLRCGYPHGINLNIQVLNMSFMSGS